MGDTKIEWATKVWNPITGCTKISAGCAHCYASTLHTRRHESYMRKNYLSGSGLPRQYAKPFNVIQFLPERLKLPNWRTPQIVFVNSMGDLFHKDVPDEWVDSALAAVALHPQDSFIILTKRADRMLPYFCTPGLHNDIELAADKLCPGKGHPSFGGKHVLPGLPLPNLWPGVSVENQEAADWRLPLLMQTPAAHRLVSVEPMIGEVDARKWVGGWDEDGHCVRCGLEREEDANHCDCPPGFGPKLDWVICGAETGPSARPMKLDWARKLRDQCREAGVPFFLKKLSKGHNRDAPEWDNCRQFPKEMKR